jgi:hypothetical protein
MEYKDKEFQRSTMPPVKDDIGSSSCGSWTLNYVGDCVSTHAMKSLNFEADLEMEVTDATTMMHGCTFE